MSGFCSHLAPFWELQQMGRELDEPQPSFCFEMM